MTQMTNMRLAVEQELQEIFREFFPVESNDLRGMLYYHMGWEGAGSGPEAQGKRIRPLLVLLCGASAGGDWHRALPAAAAVEIVHNFSLIHDDIEDSSVLRRGRATVWNQWGGAQAINAGDAMFSLAPLALARLEPTLGSSVALEAIQILFHTAVQLTRGQYLDMAFETENQVSISRYWEMVGGKTASLLAASAELGALCAGADELLRKGYRTFGWNLGLAFQALDDLLGIWGDEAELGKSTSSDLTTGKKTLPVLYGLEQQGEFSQRWLAGPISPNEAFQAAQMLEKDGAREYTQAMADRLTQEALASLDWVIVDRATGMELQSLAMQLLKRNR